MEDKKSIFEKIKEFFTNLFKGKEKQEQLPEKTIILDYHDIQLHKEEPKVEEPEKPIVKQEKAKIGGYMVEKTTENYKNGDYRISYVINGEELAYIEKKGDIQTKMIKKQGQDIVLDKNSEEKTNGFGKYTRNEKMDSKAENLTTISETEEATLQDSQTKANAPLTNLYREKIGDLNIEESKVSKNGQMIEYRRKKQYNIILPSGQKIEMVEEDSKTKDIDTFCRKIDGNKVIEISRFLGKTAIKEYNINGKIVGTYIYGEDGKPINSEKIYNNIKEIPQNEGTREYQIYKGIIDNAGIPIELLRTLRGTGKATPVTPDSINDVIKSANKQFAKNYEVNNETHKDEDAR